MAVICGWEGNRWSGVALAMRHRLCVIGLDIKILYRLNIAGQTNSLAPHLYSSEVSAPLVNGIDNFTSLHSGPPINRMLPALFCRPIVSYCCRFLFAVNCFSVGVIWRPQMSTEALPTKKQWQCYAVGKVTVGLSL